MGGLPARSHTHTLTLTRAMHTPHSVSPLHASFYPDEHMPTQNTRAQTRMTRGGGCGTAGTSGTPTETGTGSAAPLTWAAPTAPALVTVRSSQPQQPPPPPASASAVAGRRQQSSGAFGSVRMRRRRRRRRRRRLHGLLRRRGAPPSWRR